MSDKGAFNLRITGAILIVDDEESVRLTARLALEARGCTVLTASSGVEAMTVLEQNTDLIALVILDLSMPEMGGPEVLPKLLAIKPRLNVVISSGYAESDTIKLFAGLPIAGFIQKPYTAKRLAEKIREILERESQIDG